MQPIVKGWATAFRSSFTTNETLTLPEVTLTLISYTDRRASLRGNIASDGGAIITSCGVCWSLTPNPTTSSYVILCGTGSNIFSCRITDLISSKKYYARAFATNNMGTGYGEELNFTTLSETDGKVTDIDGNVYQTVAIGDQRWLGSNLKTTTYRDGTAIPEEVDPSKWPELITPAYCWYNNDSTSYKDTYGALYNYLAVTNDKICPEGYHTADDYDWHKLALTLDPEAELVEGFESLIVGDILKDGSEFNAQFGGYLWTKLFDDGSPSWFGFTDMGLTGVWWSFSSRKASVSNSKGDCCSMNRTISKGKASLGRYSCGTSQGASVRCVHY